jgi:hypothetical protein
VDDDIDMVRDEILANCLFIQQIQLPSAGRKNLVVPSEGLDKVSSDKTAAARD